MDTALMFLTAALVVITGYYAWQTRLTVNEMRESRRANDALRRRDKSESAAARALEGIRQLQNSMRQKGAGRVERQEILDLSHILDSEAPLIDDSAVSGCVSTCAVLAFTASWPDESLCREPVGSSGLVRLRLHLVIGRTRQVLEDCLREREFRASHWENLPERSQAQAWILGPADKDGLPANEP
jgi:hypothetical protein